MRLLIKGGIAVTRDCEECALADIKAENGLIVNELTSEPDLIINAYGKNLHTVDLCAYYAGQYYGLEKPQRPGRELPLGEGDVNFEKYLNALRDIGYDGYLTIEREVGENPVADIEHAVKFLDTFNVR